MNAILTWSSKHIYVKVCGINSQRLETLLYEKQKLINRLLGTWEQASW